MAAALLGAIPSVAGLFGGPDKNKIRDQQEQDSYNRAIAGSVSDAQSIYNNQKPGSKQTHERVVDDQKWWGQLAAQGWTVNAAGVVVPPGAVGAIGPRGWSAALTGGGATAAAAGAYGGAPTAPASSHSIAFVALAVAAVIAIVFMLRNHKW